MNLSSPLPEESSNEAKKESINDPVLLPNDIIKSRKGIDTIKESPLVDPRRHQLGEMEKAVERKKRGRRKEKGERGATCIIASWTRR